MLFICIFAISRGALAEMSEAYFKPSVSALATNSEFSVGVFVDSADSVNALDLGISYPSDALKFIGSDASHSIVAFWQSGKVLISEGHISLSGGILPPFRGAGGLVSTLRFRALSVGEPKLSFERSSLYLADGTGTKIDIGSSSIVLSVSASTPVAKLPPQSEPSSSDTTPPSLTVRLIKDSATSNYLIVYKASDSESDIRLVEMRTEKWLKWSDWHEVNNPEVFPAGAWSVEVRAVNDSGGKSVEALFAPYIFLKLFAIIFLLCSFLICILSV